MSREEFLAKKYFILGEFESGGETYVVYKASEHTIFEYITGSRFEWQFGLRWDATIHSIVKDFIVEDDVKKKITDILNKSVV